MPVVTEKEIRELADEWGKLMKDIGPKLKKTKAISKKIFAWLKTNNKLITINGSLATAKRFNKFGDREIPLQKFLDAAKDKTEAERNACLKVEIAKAEKLLGKETIDKIASRPTVASNALELN